MRLQQRPNAPQRRRGRPTRPPLVEVPPPVQASPVPRRRSPTRAAVFAGLAAVCLIVAVGYAALAVRRAAAPPSANTASAAGAAVQLAGQPRDVLYLRSNGDALRLMATLPTDGAAPAVSDVLCQRVHFAAGRGLCVGQHPYLGGAFVFDSDLRSLHTLPANGIPSRARVSPDGRLASMTLFVRGHEYSPGQFSTQTTLIDTGTGAVLGDLEQFTVLRDGRPVRSADFNFWGVTFASDSNRFYATLGTGGKTFLLEGDVAARELRTLRENAECPSLSPDGTRLVFKKRVDGGAPMPVWRLHVLDLATMAETPLGDARNVDDQVEWLDDGSVLYMLRDEGPPPTLRPDLWLLPVDGGSPRLFATQAMSPAVIRAGGQTESTPGVNRISIDGR